MSTAYVDGLNILNSPAGFKSGGAGSGFVQLGGATSGTVTVTAQAAAGTWTLTLPNSPGTNGYSLTTDGNGNAAWTAPSTSLPPKRTGVRRSRWFLSRIQLSRRSAARPCRRRVPSPRPTAAANLSRRRRGPTTWFPQVASRETRDGFGAGQHADDVRGGQLRHRDHSQRKRDGVHVGKRGGAPLRA